VYCESDSDSGSDSGVHGIRKICVRCKSDSNVYYMICGYACCASEAIDLFEQ
jgi:hypothetical protein